MVASLKWRYRGAHTRTAEGPGGSSYELVREITNTGTYWTAWWCETAEVRSRRLAYLANFVQARGACIDHHKEWGQ